MLAYEPGVAIAYDITLTGLSLCLAMLITGCGLSLAIYKPEGWYPAIGGMIVGGGVACMHYTGMLALELPGHIFWAPDLVAASILLGMLLGSASLMVAVRYEDRRGTLLAAVLLTLAIVSHHFTAMGAIAIAPDPLSTIHPFSLSPSALALAVAAAAVLILGLSLAGAVADRRIKE
jgi:NO-binding membrane sensor protein with MHYT domain